MADVNDDDQNTTPGQSNPDDSGQPTGTGTDDQNSSTDDSQGQAGDQGDKGEGGSDDGNQPAGDQAEGEGQKPTRGEVRHERYIDKLRGEIQQSNERSTRSTDELFGSSKPYEPIQYKPDAEYDPKQLEEDRQQTAQQARAEGIQLGLNQGSSQVQKEMWADRFDIDSERVTQRFEALNPDKADTYSPKLESELVQGYIAFVGMTKDPQTGAISIERPNVRFKDYVEAEMRNREEYAASRVRSSATNLVKQAAQTGVRPTGQPRPTKGDHGFDPNDPVGSVNRMSKKQYFELGGKEASDAYLKSRGLG